MRHPICAKVGTNFADKRRSLGGIVRLRSKATEFSLLEEDKILTFVLHLKNENAMNYLWWSGQKSGSFDE
jgi:hypothetical protein